MKPYQDQKDLKYEQVYSTDVENLAVLLVFVCYIYNFTTEEHLFFCKPLKTHTKGQDMFLLIQPFFEKHHISLLEKSDFNWTAIWIFS